MTSGRRRLALPVQADVITAVDLIKDGTSRVDGRDKTWSAGVISEVASSSRSRATLSELSPGRCGTVLAVRDDHGTSAWRRLFDLGFAPGAAVEVVRRAPMADPVIYRVAGYEIALRRAHACLVDVALTP